MYEGPTGARSARLYGSAAAATACAPAAPLASLAVVCQLLVEVVGEWLSPAEWVPLLRGAMQGPLLPGLEGGRQLGPVGEGRAAQVGPSLALLVDTISSVLTTPDRFPSCLWNLAEGFGRYVPF